AVHRRAPPAPQSGQTERAMWRRGKGSIFSSSRRRHTRWPRDWSSDVCSSDLYPLIDMLRYDQFLVGSFWVPEYGSASDPTQFQWLRAYSPYQMVKEGTKYPATLFVTGDADTRVAPLHARKMTALMQHAAAIGP